MNRFEGSGARPAKIKYLDADFQVLMPGSHVICAITGAKVPTDRAIDGTSFLPVLNGKPLQRSTPLYWQYDRAISEPKIALRDGDWKLLATADLSRFELYNLKADRAETDNLADAETDRVAALAARLKKLHAEIKREGPSWPEWKRPQKKN